MTKKLCLVLKSSDVFSDGYKIMQTPKLDPAKLTNEQRDKLEAYQQTQEQLKILNDIADISQEMLNVADRAEAKNSKQLEALGAVLTDSREQLVKLTNKDAPEAPDYAKPVVAALDKLERAIKAIKVDPQVTVDAPQVSVSAPSIDLRGIEKILKTDVPKAFQEAIKAMPQVQIPETDNTELLRAWEGISEQLVSIETATRMKPQLPTTLKVVNPDGSSIGSVSGSSYYESYVDTTTDTNLVYLGKATPGSATTDAAWQVKRYNKSTGQMSFADDISTFSKSWDLRTTYVY